MNFQFDASDSEDYEFDDQKTDRFTQWRNDWFFNKFQLSKNTVLFDDRWPNLISDDKNKNS